MKVFEVSEIFHIANKSILTIKPDKYDIYIGDSFIDDRGVWHKVYSFEMFNGMSIAETLNLVIDEPDVETRFITFNN